jgi:hypothetical protein
VFNLRSRRPLSFSKHTDSHFIPVSTTDFSWRCWVTVHHFIVRPQDLSDVAATNADRESREWYPKTKFIADNLKEKGKTNLAGEGHKWSHKTHIADILEEIRKTKLIAEGDPVMTFTTGTSFLTSMASTATPDTEHPCLLNATIFEDCMDSNGEDLSACVDCFVQAYTDFADGTNTCLDMQESGFCGDMADCASGACNDDCTAELIDMTACFLHYDGCDLYLFDSECLESPLTGI